MYYYDFFTNAVAVEHNTENATTNCMNCKAFHEFIVMAIALYTVGLLNQTQNASQIGIVSDLKVNELDWFTLIRK